MVLPSAQPVPTRGSPPDHDPNAPFDVPSNATASPEHRINSPSHDSSLSGTAPRTGPPWPAHQYAQAPQVAANSAAAPPRVANGSGPAAHPSVSILDELDMALGNASANPAAPRDTDNSMLNELERSLRAGAVQQAARANGQLQTSFTPLSNHASRHPKSLPFDQYRKDPPKNGTPLAERPGAAASAHPQQRAIGPQQFPQNQQQRQQLQQHLLQQRQQQQQQQQQQQRNKIIQPVVQRAAQPLQQIPQPQQQRATHPPPQSAAELASNRTHPMNRTQQQNHQQHIQNQLQRRQQQQRQLQQSQLHQLPANQQQQQQQRQLQQQQQVQHQQRQQMQHQMQQRQLQQQQLQQQQLQQQQMQQQQRQQFEQQQRLSQASQQPARQAGLKRPRPDSSSPGGSAKKPAEVANGSGSHMTPGGNGAAKNAGRLVGTQKEILGIANSHLQRLLTQHADLSEKMRAEQEAGREPAKDLVMAFLNVQATINKTRSFLVGLHNDQASPESRATPEARAQWDAKQLAEANRAALARKQEEERRLKEQAEAKRQREEAVQKAEQTRREQQQRLAEEMRKEEERRAAELVRRRVEEEASKQQWLEKQRRLREVYAQEAKAAEMRKAAMQLKRTRLEAAPTKDHLRILNPEYTSPFKNLGDVWQRLSPYHAFNNHEPDPLGSPEQWEAASLSVATALAKRFVSARHGFGESLQRFDFSDTNSGQVDGGGLSVDEDLLVSRLLCFDEAESLKAAKADIAPDAPPTALPLPPA